MGSTKTCQMCVMVDRVERSLKWTVGLLPGVPKVEWNFGDICLGCSDRLRLSLQRIYEFRQVAFIIVQSIRKGEQ